MTKRTEAIASAGPEAGQDATRRWLLPLNNIERVLLLQALLQKRALHLRKSVRVPADEDAAEIMRLVSFRLKNLP